MKLEDLGWNPYFAEQFELLKTEESFAARVSVVEKEAFIISSERGVQKASVSGNFRFAALVRSEFPAVGDWVIVRENPGDDEQTILAVLPRKTCFSRSAVTGKDRLGNAVMSEQVLAANLDYVFVVMALNDDFNLRRAERYVIAAKSSGAEPVLILSKADLCDNVAEYVSQLEEACPGVPIFAISKFQSSTLETLKPYLGKGKTVVLIGSSGVGKSTLINLLLESDQAKTGEARVGDGKGRHTTTWRELFVLPGGAVLIDNPGIREIGVWTPSVEDTFADIEALANECRYSKCTHTKEPGCAVLAALKSGKLEKKRYQNYQTLAEEAGIIRTQMSNKIRSKIHEKQRKQGNAKTRR
jgi:ribosome biogenesis GTPase / thiamine phosphate phosphatase